MHRRKALNPPPIVSAISFIIPTYNCAETVRESIDSIFNGNFELGDEVILINDCSTDNTAEVSLELQAQHPAIRILNHRVNKGTAAASRNTGIEHAGNDLIFCLDADNVLVPESVPQLKAHLIAMGADAAAFGEQHCFRHPTGELIYKWCYNEEITFADALAGHIWPGHGGNYLFTKQSWLKAGRYFEPTLLNQTLDSWGFGASQLGTGAKMVTLPHTHYLHRQGINSHYVREHSRGNQSLAALAVLFPFLDMIYDDDVNYMMSRKGRYIWFNNLDKRPVRMKAGIIGKTGYSINCWLETHSSMPAKMSIWKKMKHRIGALLIPKRS